MSNKSLKVFISGSRSGFKFEKFTELGEWLKKEGHQVLVGDCVGVDTMIQGLCKTYKIPCKVYHIGTKPRNNMGFDTVRCIGTKYKDKDVVMTQECDLGIAIWNGKSKGTKENIDRLKSMHKQVIVR